MSTATKAIFAIDNLEDLREAQSALNVRFRELQTRAAYAYSKGDKVGFKTKNGSWITGVVTKINQKTIEVRADAGNTWKVSPSLLSKVHSF